MSLSFNALTATTFKNYRKKFADLITEKIGLYKFLRQKDQIERKGGGLKIVEPLMYGENSTFQTYSGYDVLDNTPQEGLTAAEYSWRNASVAITISDEEMDENKGESKIISLFDTKQKQANKTFVKRMESMLFSDGTGNSGKDFNGLASFITAAASTAGGIEGSTYEWWRNQTETVTTFSTGGLAGMRSLYNKCEREGDEIDIMVTDRLSYEAYEALLTPIERINYSKGESMAGDAGFGKLTFKGKPFLWSSKAPLKKMFFLNTDYIKLVIDPAKDFKMTKWRVPVNQMARTAYIILRGNLTCSNREQQGLLTITNY